jgi:hypothetical protein
MSVTISGSGQVPIQVIQATTTTTTSTTSTSFVDSALTASITPRSASNKILVMITGNNTQTGQGIGYRITRNGTSVFNPSVLDGSTNYYYVYGSSNTYPMQLTYLDSPATTSAVTYKLQISSYSGSFTVWFPATGTSNATATITLLEVSGA